MTPDRVWNQRAKGSSLNPNGLPKALLTASATTAARTKPVMMLPRDGVEWIHGRPLKAVVVFEE